MMTDHNAHLWLQGPGVALSVPSCLHCEGQRHSMTPSPRLLQLPIRQPSQATPPPSDISTLWCYSVMTLLAAPRLRPSPVQSVGHLFIFFLSFIHLATCYQWFLQAGILKKGGQESVMVDCGSLLAFQLAKPKMSFSAKWAMILPLYCHCIIF